MANSSMPPSRMPAMRTRKTGTDWPMGRSYKPRSYESAITLRVAVKQSLTVLAPDGQRCVMAEQKLFAVYAGGRAPRANTELHDVVFAVGSAIEDTYAQLLDSWFGDPKSLHIDSWLELDVVDGYRITLADAPATCDMSLFFVNLGAYRDGEFTELHACGFYVAASAPEAKKRALAALFTGQVDEKHKDDLHAVDDLIALDTVNGLHITLTKTGETSATKPNNGYHIIPKARDKDGENNQ
ncbi:MAG: DUF1543 domain-containing protein [Sphingobacteriales bacterium]|nr:MAG: DUF1543 domain-containing protein [Sphingobacteriales bacterium]